MVDKNSASAMEVAIEAAIGAGMFALDKRPVGGSDLLVKQIERQTERLIRKHIMEAFPDDAIQGEELEPKPGTSGYTWLVDPVDGTINYKTNNYEPYCVSIARAFGDGVVLGVVYNPESKELFSALDGKQARLNEKPIKVSRKRSLADAVVYATDVLRNTKCVRRISAILNNSETLKPIGSSAYQGCLVADGRVDVYIKAANHAWGFAAAMFIVEQAGGIVRNFDGTTWSTESRQIIATNTALYNQVSGIVQS